MDVLYFLFVVLLSACGLRSVVCEPIFTSLPNSGNPVYQLKGNSLSLTWSYNPDGRVVNEKEWTFNINQRIATVVSSGTNIDAAYTSKAQVTGNTLTLSNIQEEDSGNYIFRVQFTTFDPRFIIDQAELIVVVEPKITLDEPGSITIDEGNTRTLLCVASGNPKPLITWYKGIVKVQEDAGNSNYTISPAKRNDAGRYRCLATVTAPGLSNINTAEYTVDVAVRFKPEHKVNSLSSNLTVLEDRNAEFNCYTDAVPGVLDYRWFKDGVQISNSGDYTITPITDGERLTVNRAKKASAGLYSCDGRNALGTGKQKSAYLIVNYAPQQVTVTPSDPAEVPLTQSITLTCQADGFPNPSYSWKFNGQWNGVTQNTLTLTNADVKDAGNYTCHAKNDFGFKETTKVVYVRYKPTVTKFTTGMPGNTAVEGTTVTLTCSANGYPAPTYTIKRQNTPVVSNGGKFEILDVQLSEEANTYSCETQNAEGSGPTEQLQITVLVAPTFSSQLPSTKQTKTENETVSYSCIAEAKPAATILWQLDRENLTETSPYNYLVSVAPIAQSKLLKTLAYLTINRVTWRQDGNFSCLAYNDAGEKSQTTELEVRYRPVAQSFADQPKNLTLDEGETAQFTCKTIGNPPTETHKWQFNGKDIPGESCSGCTTTTFVKSSVTLSDAGWYSCTGTNSLGEGPPARAQLLIKYPPEITFYQSSYTVNETGNVTLVCRANGVPQPRIIWTRSGSSKELAYGEQFLIVNTKGSDDGTYRCIAKNDIGQQDSVDITLNVQTLPTIVTSTPTTTQIPGAAGEQVDLTCIVNGKPPPSLSWKRDLNAIIDLTSLNDDKVKSIISERDTSILKVTVTSIGEKFYCIAVNLLGSDNQQYTIRERGVPDAPIDVKLAAFKVEGAKTVSVNVSWTPGYSGGYDQMFTIHYREKGSSDDFVEQYVGHPDNNMHTIQGLLPETEYEFIIQASNQAGEGEASALKQVYTPESSVPPDRGSVEAARMSDDATVILVTWTVTDKDVTILNLEMQEGGEGQWDSVPGGSGLSTSETELKVTDLSADKSYRFRMDMRRSGEQNPVYVLSNTVAAGAIPRERSAGETLQDWMIAVIAGVAGVLLLAIVVLALCCFKRRKKARGADDVHMSQTSNYAVGGPDVARPVDTRRSYGMESVEDAPFIVAASMQSMTSNDGKKKKQQDPSVNYGYLSQDSVQQPEVLLNPGSRLARNGRLAQSTGELDMNSAYPARGPQRDFNTLPPYHEPPSFEEAMRQSTRKPKTRKSTGDLTGPGQGRPSGRRPRQTRPADEPTDSSDGEQRFTPQRTAPPPPRVRHVESTEDPRYAPLHQQAHVMGPRVLPLGPPTDNGPRRGPLDPSVPYVLPQKKSKPKKPRHEPAIGPPPQYTPEDLSPEDPMLRHPGDLDLDDPSSLPLTERPPDLPPPMAMLPSNRPLPSNYHDDAHDGLPEPPSFLRDIVYPTDSDRDPRYDSDGAMPYHPSSPGRQRQPYINVHGQLVRPDSQDSDGFRRPESLRSSRDALTPEPEIPPNQSRSRGSESDDNRGVPEINYVSYLV